MVLVDVLEVEKPGYKIKKNGPILFFKYSKMAEICLTD